MSAGSRTPQGRHQLHQGTALEGQGHQNGSEGLLAILGEGPDGYARFAEEYYELDEVPLEMARAAYQHAHLDLGMITELAGGPEEAQEALGEIQAMPYGRPFPFDD